ncbi:hypothetical protein MN608_10118 [Microdochium nivale]|nr:hypothetical protein MN608_10118 [Microdochium nivale]
MAWPTLQVANLMVGEPVSNGGWNAVMSLAFPCPDYLLVPELTMTPRRFDFAVFDVGVNGVFFAFEGKGANWNLVNLSAEVLDSCRAIRPRGYQGYTYGMGGSGPVCFIMEWDGGAGIQYLNADANGNLLRSNNIVPHNIIDDEWKLRIILDLTRQAHERLR